MPAPVPPLRRLGKGEWYNWLIDQAACTNFVIAAEVEGVFDVERFARCLDEGRRYHPILDTRIVARGRRAWLLPAPSDGPAIAVDVRDGETDEWRAVVETEIDRSFDNTAEPPVRATILRGSDGASVVLLTFAHAIADAKSAALFLLETLRSCVDAETARTERSIVPAMEANFPAAHRGMRGLWRRLRFAFALLGDALRYGVPKRIPPHTKRAGSPRSARVQQLRLGSDTSARLLQRCRAEKTTVNGAVMAAVIRAQKRAFAKHIGDSQALACAVNLRRHLSPPRDDADLGYHIATPIAGLRLSSHPDFWSLARAARERLTTAIDRGDPFQFWNMFLPPLLTPANRAGGQRLLRSISLAPHAEYIMHCGEPDERSMASRRG